MSLPYSFSVSCIYCLRLIFVLSSIYANIEIMRNNNKELKFEFGKCLVHIRTTKNEKGTALRLGLVVRCFGLVRQFWSLSETEVHQPMLSNRT